MRLKNSKIVPVFSPDFFISALQEDGKPLKVMPQMFQHSPPIRIVKLRGIVAKDKILDVSSVQEKTAKTRNVFWDIFGSIVNRLTLPRISASPSYVDLLITLNDFGLR